MNQWRCKACGKVFLGDKPLEHGNFYVSRDGVIQDKCSGTLELLPST